MKDCVSVTLVCYVGVCVCATNSLRLFSASDLSVDEMESMKLPWKGVEREEERSLKAKVNIF